MSTLIRKIDSPELLIELAHLFGSPDPDNLNRMSPFSALIHPDFDLNDRKRLLCHPPIDCTPLGRTIDPNLVMGVMPGSIVPWPTIKDLPEGYVAPLAEQVIGFDLYVEHPRCLPGLESELFWVYREGCRFVAGEYQMPNFMAYLTSLAAQDASNNVRADNPELPTMAAWMAKWARNWWHFPHISLEDPTMVAYTPNHEYGKRDRQVRVKVGKYLSQFWGDVLTQDDIRRLANGSKGLEVKFVTGREAIRDVYENGPESCMSGGTGGFHSALDEADIHPAEVFGYIHPDGSPEFRMAVIHRGGEITARCLVHERSKLWVRTYGDDGTALGEMLDDMGYTRGEVGSFGAILLALPVDGGLVMPYLDGDCKYVDLDICVDDAGVEYVRWTPIGDYRAADTGGFVQTQPEGECDECGERVDQDELSYSGHHDMHICERCREDHFVVAYVGRRDEDIVRIEGTVEVHGIYYLDDGHVLEHHGITTDYCGNYICQEDAIEITDGASAGELCDSNDGALLYCLADDSNGDARYALAHEVTSSWIVQVTNQDHLPAQVALYSPELFDELRDAEMIEPYRVEVDLYGNEIQTDELAEGWYTLPLPHDAPYALLDAVRAAIPRTYHSRFIASPPPAEVVVQPPLYQALNDACVTGQYTVQVQVQAFTS